MSADRSILDRAYEVHTAAMKARGWDPFDPFDDPRFRWRLSPDVGDDLIRVASDLWTWTVALTSEDRLFGWPIDLDAELPPNSMLLEEREPVHSRTG